MVGGGGLLEFKVYLSPLLGEGDVERGFRESERGESEGKGGERRLIATIFLGLTSQICQVQS